MTIAVVGKGEKKMPEIKLKPCPFCGGKDEVKEIYWTENGIVLTVRMGAKS